MRGMSFTVHRNGAPEEIRTPDPQIRSLVLYPAELRARFPLHIRGLKAGSIRDRPGHARKSALATRSDPDWQAPEMRSLGRSGHQFGYFTPRFRPWPARYGR